MTKRPPDGFKPTEDDIAWLLTIACSGHKKISDFVGAPTDVPEWRAAVDRFANLFGYISAAGVEFTTVMKLTIRAEVMCRWLLNNMDHVTLTGNTSLSPHLKKDNANV